jgi:hypothetical protein
MRNKAHTGSVAILLAAVLIAVLLPVTVLFSREDPFPEATSLMELSVVPIASTPPQPGRAEWTDHATQSASMVLVGALLIGIGSVVRRGVSS